MPIIGSNILAGASGAAGVESLFGTYEGKSLILEDSSNEVLERSPSSEGDRDIWTFSCWFKRGELGSDQSILAAWTDDNNRAVIRFNSNNNINYQSVEGGSTKEIVTNKRFLDTTSWYHLCLTVNDGLQTETDRYRIFINGVEETDLGTNTAHFRSGLGKICDNVRHWIGARGHSSGPTVDSYASVSLAAVKLIDGQALLPTAFGEFNEKTGVWVPKDYGNKTSQIAQGTGTAFGDLDQQGGLAAAFNGTRVQAYTAGAASSGSASTSYIGKDWGSGNTKTITGFAIYGSSDYGVIGGAASTFTVKLYGSNSSPTNSTDGTLLYTTSSVTDNNSIGHVRWFEDAEVVSHETVSSFTKTAFRYSWLTVTPNATDGVYLAEVEFYEQGSSSNYGTTGFDLDFQYAGGIERGGETEFTLTSGTVLQRTAANDSSAYFNHVLTGNFRFDWRAGSTSYNAGDSQKIGIIPATQRGSWNHATGNGGSGTNWYVNFGNTGASDGQAFEDGVAESHTAVTYTTSTVFSLRREGGSTIKLYVDGSLSHTYGTTSSADMVFFYGAGEKVVTGTITNFSFEDDGNGNSGNFYTLGLGNDISGNNNDWEIEEGAVQGNDTPVNNFPVMNQNDNDDSAITNGNLVVTGTGSNWDDTRATMAFPRTGKWYFEVKASSISAENSWVCGIQETNFPVSGQYWYHSSDFTAAARGRVYGVMDVNHRVTNGSETAMTLAIAAGDIIGFKVDLDDNELGITVDGSDKGKAFDITNDCFFLPSVSLHSSSAAIFNFGQDSTFNGTEQATSNADGNGYGTFHSSVPSGYLSLCQANLPTPSIGTTDSNRGTDYVNVVLYTGNGTAIGSGGNAITGVGFSPDFVTIRARNGSGQNNMNFDSVRGVTKRLYWDGDGAEATDTETLTAFGADGFTVGNHGNVNTNTTNYVSWNWLAGTAVSGDTTGSGTLKTYTGQVNTDSKFAIIKYVGNGSDNHTIPHHIGAAPDFVISTRLTGTDGWYVFHSRLTSDPSSDYVRIDNTDATSDEDEIWTDAVPTSTVVNLGTNTGINANDVSYIMYAWANGDSFMSGHYEGSGSASDPVNLWCGFRPQIVITRRYDSGDNWRLIDTARNPHNDTTTAGLKLNASDTESDAGNRNIDFTASGAVIRDTDADTNASGGDYIWCAWAHTPFKFGKGF